MGKLFDDSGVMHLSVSSMEAFKTCPRKFFYGKVQGLQPKARGGLQGGPLVVGTAVHDMIEAVYNGSDARTVDLSHMDQDSADKALAGLAAYNTYASVYDDFKIVEQETEFAVPMDNDHGIKLKFKGRIDGKGEYPDGSRIIVEYKTASQFWSREKKSLAEQGVLYEMAAGDTDGLDYSGTLWNFIRLTQRSEYRGGPKVWYGEVQREFKPASDAARVQVYDNAVEVALNIQQALDKGRESAFHRVPGDQCRWCDFRMLCETAYHGGDVDYLKSEYYEIAPDPDVPSEEL